MSETTFDIVQSLHNQILSKYPSVKQFCEQNNICRHNLSKVFSGHQEISIGLYLRINIALGVLPPESNIESLKDMTLKDYMQVDFFAVNRAIIHNLRNG